MRQRLLPALFFAFLGLAFLPASSFAQVPLGGGPAQDTDAEAASEPDSDAKALETLADLLENDDTRAALVAALRRLAEEGHPAADRTADALEPAPAEPGVVERLAGETRDLAEALVTEIEAAVLGITRLDLSVFSGDRLSDFGEAALRLALVIATVLVFFRLLHWLAGGLFRRLEAASLKGWLGRIFVLAGSLLLDVTLVLLAWVAGYALALFALNTTGVMDVEQSLFLNAFLAIELGKTGARLIFAPRHAGLRILPIGDEDAVYWYGWIARLVSFLGYGLLVVVPILSLDLAPAVGQLVNLVILLLGFLLALLLVLQNRRSLRQQLTALAERQQLAVTRGFFAGLSRTWHLLAIFYFVALTVVALLRPEQALSFMLQATLQTAIAVVAGLAVSAGLARAIQLGIHLPKETRHRLPMLEGRLNAYVPTVLRVVRVVVAIAVVAFVADAWGLFDVVDWAESQVGGRVLGTVVTVLFVLFGALVLWLVIASWIEHRLNPGDGAEARLPSARARTLLTIFRNSVAITLVIVTTMVVLSEIGLDIGPLLAGAGVIGLAIGFGAQKLVQDVITGVFIQLENAMNAGDVVNVAGIGGVVEKLTIRSAGIRDLNGTFHVVPFSSVTTVSNFMRGFAYHVGEYGIAYRENVDQAVEVLRQAFAELKEDPALATRILDDLEVHGVTAMGDNSVTLRIRIKTLAGGQWDVGRAYNRLVKKHFDAAGIEIPFPQRTLWFGQAKDGTAPPLPLKQVPKQEPEAESS